MKTLDMTMINGVAQGEITLFPISTFGYDEIPADEVNELAPVNGEHVLAHSESGHHHIMRNVRCFQMLNDPLTSFIQVDAETTLDHMKSASDSHEGYKVYPGTYIVRTARESSPEGWRRAVD